MSEEEFSYKYKKPKRKKRILFFVLILFLALIGSFVFKTGFTLNKILVIKEKLFSSPNSDFEYTPQKDEDRINILILGIRGSDDSNGGLLSDAIVLLNIKKSSGKVALISIPRDLYVEIPGGYEGKVNSAHALGEIKYGSGLAYSKKVVSYVSGTYIDYAISLNFEGFEGLVGLLGGITIFLEEPFVEATQWKLNPEFAETGGEFHLAAGENKLNGKMTLFYVRSRFSSSDFDRIRRQQQVVLALKDKILSLGILVNPFKINEIFDLIAENVQTDVAPWELKNLIQLAKNADAGHITKRVFDTAPEGLLYATDIDETFVLLPKSGNWEEIRTACQNIFE